MRRVPASTAFELHPMRTARRLLAFPAKAEIVSDITATLQRVLGKSPEYTHIVIDEVEPENWGFAGLLTTEHRKREGRSK